MHLLPSLGSKIITLHLIITLYADCSLNVIIRRMAEIVITTRPSRRGNLSIGYHEYKIKIAASTSVLSGHSAAAGECDLSRKKNLFLNFQ